MILRDALSGVIHSFQKIPKMKLQSKLMWILNKHLSVEWTRVHNDDYLRTQPSWHIESFLAKVRVTRAAWNAPNDTKKLIQWLIVIKIDKIFGFVIWKNDADFVGMSYKIAFQTGVSLGGFCRHINIFNVKYSI